MDKIKEAIRRLLGGSAPVASVFAVNKQSLDSVRVNVRTHVNLSEIREETDKNGRLCIVIPSKTLPDDVVMNGIMYPAAEIERSFNTLEGTPAPMGHPIVDGSYVPAAHPEAYPFISGVINRNVKRVGGVVHLEKWVDKEYAERNHPRLIEAINKKEPIDTSTGLVLKRIKADGKRGYEYTATNMVFDHDAILLDEPGAAGPEQGVGMMVNEDRQLLVINSSLASDQTTMIRAILPEDAWYLDHDHEKGVVYYEKDGKEYAQVYTDIANVLSLSGVAQPVVKKTIWETIKTAVAGNKRTSPKDIDMNEEQKAAFAELIAAAVAPIANKLDGLTQDLEGVKAAHEEQAANRLAEQTAAEQTQRVVVEKALGKEVADALTGNALAVAFAKCQTADAITGGFALSTNTQADPLAGYEKE